MPLRTRVEPGLSPWDLPVLLAAGLSVLGPACGVGLAVVCLLTSTLFADPLPWAVFEVEAEEDAED